MMTRRIVAAPRAFTMVELLIAVVVVSLLLMVSAPSIRDMLELQRLRSVNADLVTDLQYARTEAVSRNFLTTVKLGRNSSVSCYVIFTGPASACDCTRGAGSACTSGTTARELRTVSVATGTGITLVKGSGMPEFFEYDPRTGGIRSGIDDAGNPTSLAYVIDVKGSRRGWLQTTVNPAGRPTVCTRDAVSGVAAC